MPSSSQADRPTLADLLVGVAALGLGLAMNRVTPPGFAWVRDPGLRPPAKLFIALHHGLQLAVPHLLTLSQATLLVRLRRPWPAPQRLGREPGFVACAAVGLVVVAEALMALPRLGDRRYASPSTLFVGFADVGGAAVAAAWLTLILGGRWQARGGWVDLAGRLLGLSWLGASLAHHAMFLLPR